MYRNIPNELKNIQNWVCWKAYPDANSHSGIKKVPINPVTGDLDTAAADKADARKLKEDYNAKIQNINAEAEEILAQARQKALDNEAKIIAEAKEEAARILSRANAQVELERKAAADDMKKEMIALASLMAEKAVAGAVDAKVQDTMVESTLKEIGEDTWRK